MERRKFIKLSAAASAIGLTPFQLQAALKSFVPFADCPDISNRKLVLINLAGANDGLNMVIPISQYSTYAALRPNIRINETGTGAYINFHEEEYYITLVFIKEEGMSFSSFI